MTRHDWQNIFSTTWLKYNMIIFFFHFFFVEFFSTFVSGNKGRTTIRLRIPFTNSPTWRTSWRMADPLYSFLCSKKWKMKMKTRSNENCDYGHHHLPNDRMSHHIRHLLRSVIFLIEWFYQHYYQVYESN
jgi:hypothetical protein